jgi:hypothetical protein
LLNRLDSKHLRLQCVARLTEYRKRGFVRDPHSEIPWHVVQGVFVKKAAEPLVEPEIRETQAPIARRKCHLTEPYLRFSIGIEINSNEIHLLSEGFREVDHFTEIARSRALDRRVPVGDRNVLPVWRVECRSQSGEAVDVDLDETCFAVKT